MEALTLNEVKQILLHYREDYLKSYIIGTVTVSMRVSCISFVTLYIFITFPFLFLL